MFKELFKRWFGKPEPQKESQIADKQIKAYKTFRSIEEGRAYVLKYKKNRTHKQLARFLNKNGYRTVKGLPFTESSVQFYTKNDKFLAKKRTDAREYARKKRKEQLIKGFTNYMRVNNLPIWKYGVSITSEQHYVMISLEVKNEFDFEQLRENDCSLLLQIKRLSQRYFKREVDVYYERSYKTLDEPFIV